MCSNWTTGPDPIFELQSPRNLVRTDGLAMSAFHPLRPLGPANAIIHISHFRFPTPSYLVSTQAWTRSTSSISHPFPSAPSMTAGRRRPARFHSSPRSWRGDWGGGAGPGVQPAIGLCASPPPGRGKLCCRVELRRRARPQHGDRGAARAGVCLWRGNPAGAALLSLAADRVRAARRQSLGDAGVAGARPDARPAGTRKLPKLT